MSKEKILEAHLVKLISEHKDYNSVDKLKKLPEYEIMLSAMQEYADQEKEKVTVAFAEWKENETEYINEYYYLSPLSIRFKTNSDLYQYFIEKIYSK